MIRPVAFLSFFFSFAAGAAAQVVSPFETDRPPVAPNKVDELVLATLEKRGITPANPCSDEVFVRRVYFDVIGTLPGPEEVVAFLDSSRPEKRAALIEALLAREEFADYWSLKWCDILRVKSEFPINLWPNAVQAYHRWIHDALRGNMPYDRFARELLTSSGSNFRVPQVNFYRAVQGREPSAIAAAVALTFMGTRIESWRQERRAGMEAIFSRIAFKQTAEWKEEIVLLDPAKMGPLETILPDGSRLVVPGGEDPRKAFADWLITPENERFSANIVNRIWSWLLGRGIVHEPDDIRPDNPPANPELLAFLERELAEHGYDTKHIYRLILNSRTYQQSSIPRSDDPAVETLFACYPVRQLEAEVLVDALCQLTGASIEYSSPIPEPYTYIPGTNRTITLADGSITNSYLELFGRPARDTGLESERKSATTDAQRLFMLNSSIVQNGIAKSPLLKRLARTSGRNPRRFVTMLYLSILSRKPTAGELEIAEAYAGEKGRDPGEAAVDLAWALVNTKEFLYRH
ncbi:MAG: DUF1553 domain-containing protein [Planctomycetes bacterium]|nr:DUF1553 domain-containing protein [Planctomycetota bacterium]